MGDFLSSAVPQFPVQVPSSLPIQYPVPIYYPPIGQDLNTWRYGPQQKCMKYPVHDVHRRVPILETEHPDYPSVMRAVKMKQEYEQRQRLAQIQRGRLPQVQRLRKSPSDICYPNICSSAVEINPIFHPFFEKFKPDVRNFNGILNLHNPFNRY